MNPAHRNPRLHLVSGLAFLIAGIIFLMLAFTNPASHRPANLLAGLAFLLAASLQVLAYRRRRHA